MAEKKKGAVMHPDYNPHDSFLATWHLLDAIYGPNLWASDYDYNFKKGDKRRPVIRPPHQLFPNNDGRSGAFVTTGGIGLSIYYGVPTWIETPWGEWNFETASRIDMIHEYRGDVNAEELLKVLDVDYEFSRLPKHWRLGSGYIALRSIKDIKLPPKETLNALDRSIIHTFGEWLALCMVHNKPIPVWNEVLNYYLDEAKPYVRIFRETANITNKREAREKLEKAGLRF